MKFRSIILLVAILMTFLFQGCVGTRDVSSQSPYSELMGKKFVLQQDCYVYRFKDENRIRIGIDGGGYGQFLPNQVSPEFIQKQLKYVEIFSIMPKESLFIIVGCEEEREPENTFRRFKAMFANSSIQGQVLDVSDLTDMSKTPPVFREKLAAPIQ